MSPLRLPPLSLYIHIPWCERKCPYCDFNSHEHSEPLPEREYAAALLRSLDQALPQVQDRALHSVFLGGGTPSLFGADTIATILRGVGERVALKEGAEITLEANPGSAEREKFQDYADAGVNRISLGVQSFDDARLAALGRIHDSEQALEAVGALRETELDSFNIDLMHGLPGQNQEMAQADLQRAADQQVPHISWYQLTIEPNTAFHKRPPKLPAEPVLEGIQEQGESLLRRAGYSAYEVSAWSRPGHRCHHNLNYWQFGDYIGIGAGAHGKWTELASGLVRRTTRPRQPASYLDQPEAMQEKTLDRADLVGEYMMNALRLHDGFELADFSARTGLSSDVLEEPLTALLERGLLEQGPDPQRLRASALGRRFLDSVVAEFF